MSRPRVYKLIFGVDYAEGITPLEIYFKTTMKDSDLVMLIKVWMYKLADYVAEYYFYEEEMMELLETFGCKQISKDENFRTYYSADMYEIWEAANIKPTDKDMNNPKFYNDDAQKVLMKVLKRNDEEHLESGLKNNIYKNYMESYRKEFEEIAERLGVAL